MNKKFFFFVTILLFCTSASAASYFRERTITGVGITYVGDKSVMLITFDGDKTGIAACATTTRFAIDSSAPHYKEMVSLAMTAYTSKQNTVDIYVTQTCNFHDNAQDMLGIKMGSMPW